MKKNYFVFFSAFLNFSCLLIIDSAHAATYYASPGDELTSAASQLIPGDLLVLRNGTYRSGINLDCQSNAQSGTASSPITIKAENERRAHIETDGTFAAIKFRNCSYWIVEGIHASGADNPAYGNEDLFSAYQSSNLTFRRNLLHHNNRYFNVHLLGIYHGANGPGGYVIEENEFYYHHRHAIIIVGGHDIKSVIRRNYGNMLNRSSIPGGSPGGGCLVSLYPAMNTIVENNVQQGDCLSEANAAGPGDLINNRYYGNISLNGTGIFPNARGDTAHEMPRDTYIENQVVINNRFGLFSESAKNTQCVNCSFIGGYSGYWSNPGSGTNVFGDGQWSSFLRNILLVDLEYYGIGVASNYDFGIDYVNHFNLDYPMDVSVSDSRVSNVTSIDPRLGTCKLWIPDNSPMKGAGKSGADIGANILYGYENGVLTSKPLWNPRTGEFPCGAIVPGVNDIPGESCFDVHQRLNVNTNGCYFPAGYGGS